MIRNEIIPVCIILQQIVSAAFGMEVPKDSLFLLGHEARMNCSVTDGKSVFWQHKPIGSSSTTQDVFISKDGFLDAYAAGRHSLANPGSGKYDLLIKDIRESDAGTYSCITNAGLGQTYSAELTVLAEGLPVCTSEAVGVTGCNRVSDRFEFSCSVNFTGNYAPVLQWLNTKTYDVIKNRTDTTTTYSVLSTTFNYFQTSWPDIQCHVKGIPSPFGCSAPKISAMYAFDTSIVEKNAQNETYSCRANASGPCNYRWTRSNDHSVVSTVEQLNLADVGPGNYECLANCSVGALPCIWTSVRLELPAVFPGQSSLTAIAIIIPIVLGFVIILIVVIICWRKKRSEKAKKLPNSETQDTMDTKLNSPSTNEHIESGNEKNESTSEQSTAVTPVTRSVPDILQSEENENIKKHGSPESVPLLQLDQIEGGNDLPSKKSPESVPLLQPGKTDVPIPPGDLPSKKSEPEEVPTNPGPQGVCHEGRINFKNPRTLLGITWKNNRVYVICSVTNKIFVFEDSHPFASLPKETITIEEMKDPRCITSMDNTKFLLVCDLKGKCLWGVDSEKKQPYQVMTLEAGEDVAALSSSSKELKILMKDPACINIFEMKDLKSKTPEAVVSLDKVQLPWFAIKSVNEEFVICHKSTGIIGNASLVNIEGNVIHHYDNLKFLSQVAVNETGKVFVVDGDDRVVLLNSQLSFERIIATNEDKDDDWDPTSLCYSTEKHLLMVGHMKSGKIDVYSVHV